MIPNFKALTNTTSKQVRRRLISFKKIKSNDLSPESVKKLYNISFSLPIDRWPQKAGGTVYRGRINNSDNKPFETKERISYNKIVSRIGRANLIGKPVFYASSSLDTSIIETCIDKVRKKERFNFFLTVGEWKIVSDLFVSIICHSDRALKAGTDLKIAYEAIRKKHKNEKSQKDFRIWIHKMKFLSEQFEKKNIFDDNDYLFTAIYADLVFSNKDKKLHTDGIYYPSVAYRYKGFNVAFNVNLLDNQLIVLKKVYYYKCEFKRVNKYPIITHIKSTENIQDNNIIWGTG